MLKCERGLKVSALMNKLKQYYYEGAGKDGLFSDQACQQRVEMDGLIEQKQEYFLSMTVR